MLERLSVRDFRCFDRVQVELDPEMTALVGRNGQGKTSLLEAACVLLRLQSPRTSSREEWIRFGQTAAVVEGSWGELDLRVAVTEKARRLAVDGAVCGRSGEYLERSGVVVWMDHSDMNLLRGGGDHRRRFLDFAGSQAYADYLPALRAYERALRGRNYVLKRDAVIKWKEAEAFGRVMAEHARVLTGRRAELCKAMRLPVADFHARVSGGEEVVELGYTPGSEGEDLGEELLAWRDEEARLRVTLRGPHRDDLEMVLRGQDARAFASEGQQRTLALAMKLSQARVLFELRGQAPLLLVDDVFGELDVERRRAFLSCLPLGTQKILTTTRMDWLGDGVLGGRVYEVAGGGVGRVD
jgi:DNA replication and repair protein RecF